MATKHLLWVLIFTILTLFTACIRPQAQEANRLLPTTAQLQGEGNELLAGMEQGALTVDIRSATGIGTATLTLTTERPLTATLRLHLAGLEHLQVSNGVTTLVAQVSSHGDHAVIQAVAEASTPAAAVEPISPDHPLWLTIEPSRTAQPYFTVILPSAFVANIDQTLTIKWIDFYR